MLKSQVIIGGEYMTDVSGNEVRVKVLYEITDTYSHRTKYMVRRVDNGRDLDKPRGPGVLYPCKVDKKTALDLEVARRILDFLTQPIPS